MQGEGVSTNEALERRVADFAGEIVRLTDDVKGAFGSEAELRIIDQPLNLIEERHQECLCDGRPG